MKPWQADYHCHTGHFLCAEKEMISRNILPIIRAQGTKVLGLTEHIYPYEPSKSNNWDFIKVFKDIRHDFLSEDISIIVGAEICIEGRSGRLSVQDEAILDIVKPDYVLGGSFHVWLDWVDSEFYGDWDKFLVMQHESMINACANPLCDAIAHPWTMPLEAYKQFALPPLDDYSKIPIRMVEELGQVAYENRCGIEINSNLLNPKRFENTLGLWDQILKSFKEFILCLLEKGAKIYFGSDSHKLEDLSGPKMLYDQLGIDLKESNIWKPEVVQNRFKILKKE